jgi:hypothetical protein
MQEFRNENMQNFKALNRMATLSALRSEFRTEIRWSLLIGVVAVDVGLLHVHSQRIKYPLVILASLLLLASQLDLICEERAQQPYLPYL